MEFMGWQYSPDNVSRSASPDFGGNLVYNEDRTEDDKYHHARLLEAEGAQAEGRTRATTGANRPIRWLSRQPSIYRRSTSLLQHAKNLSCLLAGQSIYNQVNEKLESLLIIT
jgi:hypothetical protein